MRIKFRNSKDVWIFVGVIAAITTIASLLSILLLFLIGGEAAFNMQNAIIFASTLPLIISVPISLWFGRTGMNLTLAQTELQRLADTDPLTGLSNRRSFFADANQVVADSSKPCALLVIDADHFKDLNDNYGHAVGDTALVNIADVLRSSFRDTDLICRVGGEEFAVLLPGASSDQATTIAQRVVDAVADSPIVAGNAIITYSVSCGVAEARRGEALADLFKRADDAMYAAKECGRNQVALHEQAA